MNYPDVHWKGHPHCHIPRIRVAPGRSSRSRSLVQADAEQAVRRQLNIPRSKKSQKFKFNIRFRRRKARTSRSTSSQAWARRRASTKARQAIQVYGWDSTVAEVASIVTALREGDNSSIRLKTRLQTSHADHFAPGTTNTTIRPLTDGAASSALINTGAIRDKNLKGRPIPPSTSCCAHKQQRRTTQRDVHLSSRNIAQTCPYDYSKLVRQDYLHSSKLDSDRYPTGTTKREQKYRSIIGRVTYREDKKGENIGAQGLGKYRDPSLRQTNDYRDLETATASSALTSLFSEQASRNSSQRRALEQFTQELNHYLRVAEAFPKPEPESSPAPTIVSAITVAALKPYQYEFQLAGLAVTSDEQRGTALTQSRRSLETSAPPLVDVEGGGGEGDSRSRHRNSEVEKDSKTLTWKVADPSQLSHSTGTTVIGFTPPHEKSYGLSETPVSRRRSSSDHNVIDFTPSRGKHMQAASQTSRPSAKKPLPWLPKQGLQSDKLLGSKRSKQTTTLKDDGDRDMILPLSPQEPLPLVDIIGRSSEKGTELTYKPSGQPSLSHPLSESKSRNTNAEQGRPAASKSSDVPDPTLEVAHIPISMILECSRTQCSDSGTQTHRLHGGEKVDSVIDRNNVANRAPPPTSPHKNFQSVAFRCPEVCHTGSKKALPFEPILKPRLSKLHLKRAHRMAQIDEVGTRPYIEPQIEGFLPSTLPQIEENDQSSAPSSNSGMVPSSPLTASLTRSLEDESVPWDKISRSQRNDSIKSPHAPSAQRSPIPRCTQCDCDIEHAKRVSTRKPPLEPEYEIRLVPRKYPAHRCRARSSIQCQQCLSSGRETATVSPLQNSIPLYQSKSAALDAPGDYSACHEAIFDTLSLVTATRGEHSKRTSLDSCQNFLIPELVKRPTLSKLETINSLQPRLKAPAKSVLDTASSLWTKALPQIPQTPLLSDDFKYFSEPGSQNSRSASADTCRCSRADFSQKFALRGLRVAIAAACDEDVDRRVEETTGLAVRRFLADLGRFEHLSYDSPKCAGKREEEAPD